MGLRGVGTADRVQELRGVTRLKLVMIKVVMWGWCGGAAPVRYVGQCAGQCVCSTGDSVQDRGMYSVEDSVHDSV